MDYESQSSGPKLRRRDRVREINRRWRSEEDEQAALSSRSSSSLLLDDDDDGGAAKGQKRRSKEGRRNQTLLVYGIAAGGVGIFACVILVGFWLNYHK